MSLFAAVLTRIGNKPLRTYNSYLCIQARSKKCVTISAYCFLHFLRNLYLVMRAYFSDVVNISARALWVFASSFSSFVKENLYPFRGYLFYKILFFIDQEKTYITPMWVSTSCSGPSSPEESFIVIRLPMISTRSSLGIPRKSIICLLTSSF